MRLSPDCIRDILITIEDNVGFGDIIEFNLESKNSYDRLAEYDYEEVLYHINQCSQSKFIQEPRFFLDPDDGCIMGDLTPSGHEFLANIRSDTNWNKTKEIAKNVGSFSLDALTKIATAVITSIINKSLNP